MFLIIIDALLAAVFEIVLEFVLGIVGEFLLEYGLDKLGEKISSRSGIYELLVIIGHGFFGVVLGIGSTYIYSDTVIEDQALKIANFIVMPLIFGFSTCLVSWLLERSTTDRRIFQFSEFVAGVVFGITYIAARALTHM